MSDWGDDEPTPAPRTVQASLGGDDDDWGTSEAPAMEPRGRGRGGAGRGAGGGGSRTCHKCNEEGHMARECPNADSRPSGGGGGGRACFKCNEEGHMARECPNADNSGGGGGNSGCRKCGEDGHYAKDCPQGGGGGGGNSGCRKCGEDGHYAKDCPQGGGGGGGGGKCYNCGEEGHMSKDCTEPKKEGSSGCRKCGEEGHFARDCPQEGGGTKGCFNCGEEGHMSKDCTNERKEDVDRPARQPKIGEDGKEIPLENYVPPEMLEGDAIFDERKQVREGTGTGINFSKYESIPHSVSGDSQVPSVVTFAGLGLRPLILENLKKCGYESPTPIQKHGSPQLMAGLHVMCCAQTGSGKTAAFLLPIINRLLQQQESLSCAGTSPVKPEALILAPTRELAIQIGNEANMYAAGSIIRTQVVYGGTATFALKNKLMRGCNILVATTGRLKQFVRDGVIDLSGVQYFILDEADRMLDMGFMQDVDEIVPKMPAKEERVSGMFSATFPQEIQTAAAKYLHNYIYIVIGVVGGACTDVKQEIMKVEKSEKREKLIDILNAEGKDNKVLVFCASKRGADFLATHLATNGVSVTSIHGDRLQSQRETALREFSTGKRQVLVATAVAARGLDIPKVGLVINFDLPTEIDEYVHRIGRTGRVGHTGRAISFYDEAFDSNIFPKLEGILKGAGQEVPDFLQGMQSNGNGGGFEEGDFASVDHRKNAGAAPAAAAADDEDW